MENKLPSSPPLLSVWIWLCAYLNCAGWVLSALGQLNAGGYAGTLAAGLVLAWIFRRSLSHDWNLRINPQRFRRRCRRVFPAIFFLVAALIWLGGCCYAPSNYDALTYRLPRLLNWLAAGHWFWIPTLNERMNFSGAGWEWLAAPQLALLHTDRGLFLINAIGYLLMPGLLFSIFRQLGVPRRAAWTWMWLLPLAYGYATQAGSVGNDLTGTIFGLLAVYFGLRARRSGRAGEVWLALLAAALMTGVKLTNLPLALPCLVAVWPALFQVLKQWRELLFAGLTVAAVCVLVSALPIMALNQKFSGGWSGDPDNCYQAQVSNPLAGLAANTFLVAEQSLVPPILPGARKIHAGLFHALPHSLKDRYPRLHLSGITEFPGEEGAGLGLGVTLPLLLGLGAAVIGLKKSGNQRLSNTPPVVSAAWIAALFYLAKVGSEAGPRLLLPYYPLAIIPLLRLAPQARWLQRKNWRRFLVLTALGVLPVLILSVSRPLWPAVTVSGRLARQHPQSRLLQRLFDTYDGYSHRNDVLAAVRAKLPPEARTVGVISGNNDTLYSLWRPFGQRQAVDLRAKRLLPQFLDHPDDFEWVVVKEKSWPKVSSIPLETWVTAHHGQILARVSVVELISWGPEKWMVVHFKPEA